MEQEKIKKIPERIARTKRLLPVYNVWKDIIENQYIHPANLVSRSNLAQSCR
jgi:hypothetical protein